jgi:hypothetical protein
MHIYIYKKYIFFIYINMHVQLVRKENKDYSLFIVMCDVVNRSNPE